MTDKECASAELIVVDWGTTSLRATLVNRDGTIVCSLETQAGIHFITNGDYETQLLEAIGPWTQKHGPLPIVALGMVTSRNGWVEVPYITCPATIDDLAKGTIQRRLPNGSPLVFLPGITDKRRQPFPDVMRGEETQIVGFGLTEARTLVLPGTHSKWAQVSEGQIERFQTFVTGEIYALLSQHSFIAKTTTAGSPIENWPAFDRGVCDARDNSADDQPLLSLLFSARTGMLANQLESTDIQNYVSGLLIGDEFRSADRCGWLTQDRAIGIVGNDGLNERYGRAAALFGLTVQEGGENQAVTGALLISDAAGLLHQLVT